MNDDSHDFSSLSSGEHPTSTAANVNGLSELKNKTALDHHTNSSDAVNVDIFDAAQQQQMSTVPIDSSSRCVVKLIKSYMCVIVTTSSVKCRRFFERTRMYIMQCHFKHHMIYILQMYV